MFGKAKVLIITLLLFVVLSPFSFAQENVTKDTDLDGVSDEAEINIYKTNIHSPDSDNDGVLDATEIIDATNPNDPTSNKILDARNEPFLSNDAPAMWYIGRISGIASFIMFTLVILFGLSMTSKIWLKFRIVLSADALDMHMFLATFVAFLLLLLHIGSFFFDEFIRLSVKEVFIPFTLERELSSSLGYDLKVPVSLGVIAFYLAIVLLVSSHFRNKLISNKVWRKLHYSSFIFYILFLLHGIFSGSDTNEGWMIAIYALSAISVITMILLRIFGKKYFMPSLPVQSSPVNAVPKE